MVALTAAVYVGGVTINDYWKFVSAYLGSSFGGSPNRQLVSALFLSYYVVAGSVLIGFGAVKIVFERINGDLIYTTTLTPGRIVWGKVQLGIVISLLFGSMTLPFLTVAWLGRGVDVLGIFVTFLFVFALIQMHYASTLAMFAGATSFTAVYARLLPWFIGQVMLFFLALMIIFEPPPIDQWEFVPGLLCASVVFCTIAYLLATAQFAPETANRMFPIRVGLTILFGVFTTGMFVVMIFDKTLFGSGIPSWWVLLFAYSFLALWMLVPYLFLVFICERTELSNRQRQRIPVSLIGRLVAFPFYSGVANAMVWSVGLVLFGILFLIVADYCTKGAISSASNYDPFYGLHTFSLLFFDYCATSLLLCSLLLRKWMSRHWNWVPIGMLVGTLISTAFVGSWFPTFSKLLWEFLKDYPLLPYTWPTVDKDIAYMQYLLGEIWLIILCIAGLPWVIRAFRKFKRNTEPGPVVLPSSS